MRKTVTQGLYLLLTELIALYLVAWPVSAFQISSSSTGYVRVATSAAIGAYQTAQRAVFTSAVASAVSAPTMASVAVRIATGPVGWTALGVSAALTLAGMYYSAQDVQAVKTAALAAAPPVSLRSDGSGTVLPSGAVWSPSSCVHPCAVLAAVGPLCPVGLMTLSSRPTSSLVKRKNAFRIALLVAAASVR